MPVVSCIEEHPTTQTIKLGGRYIALRRLCTYTGVDEAYLSRILAGKRDPMRMSIGMALQISAALGMSIDELIQAILDRAEALKLASVKAQMFVDYVEVQQQQAELSAARKGLPPPPRIPLSA